MNPAVLLLEASLWATIAKWLRDIPWLRYGVAAFILLNFVLLTVTFLVYLERKISARFQNRLGPMRVGPYGILQSIADVIKLLLKEDIIPTKADRIVFTLAPAVLIVPAILVWVAIPFSNGVWVTYNLNIGLFYIFSVASLGVIGIVMAGWAPNNKYNLLGGLRSAAQVISYEVPLAMVILAVVVLAGRLDLQGIVSAQAGWRWNLWRWPYLIVAIPGFIVYMTCAIAETNRVPFDIPEAESELVSGFHTEYSGMKFALFFLAEFAMLFAHSAIATAVFLGGWYLGPFVIGGFAGAIVFLVKCYVLIYIFMWVRWTLPRVRSDQLMTISWKALLPISMILVFVAALIAAWVGEGG